jgi:hypothetical protein
VGLEPSPTYSPNDLSRFIGAARIEDSSGMKRSLWVRAAMAAHQQVERMRAPATVCRPQTLAVQGGGKIGIGRHAGTAQFIEQETQHGRRKGRSRDLLHCGHDHHSTATLEYGERGAFFPASRSLGLGMQLACHLQVCAGEGSPGS